MNELKNEIIKMLDSIDKTTTLFYQQKNETGYIQLESTLVLLTQGIDHVLNYNRENEIIVDEKQMNQVLSTAMKAMEDRDTILLSDILEYDLKELFNNILEII